MSGETDEFDLYDVCEADEVYVTAREKGFEDEDGSPRERGLSKKRRGTFESDKPPVLTLMVPTRVSRLERRIVERSESGEPRFGGVNGASIGKSVPETPGSILEQAEPRFDE